jgi:hypothetical protein
MLRFSRKSICLQASLYLDGIQIQIQISDRRHLDSRSLDPVQILKSELRFLDDSIDYPFRFRFRFRRYGICRLRRIPTLCLHLCVRILLEVSTTRSSSLVDGEGPTTAVRPPGRKPMEGTARNIVQVGIVHSLQ